MRIRKHLFKLSLLLTMVTVQLFGSIGTAAAAAGGDDAPFYGVMNGSGNLAKIEDYKKAGISVVLLEVFWDKFEPVQGQFDQSYVSSVKKKIKRYSDNGIKVFFELGFQYAPAWVFGLNDDTKFVNQYGDVWAGGIGNNIPDAVFNDDVKNAQKAYIEQLAANFSDMKDAFYGVRVGGLGWDELRYPDATFNGHKNSYWAFSGSANAMKPELIQDWKPGDADDANHTKAKAFLDFYFDNLGHYQNFLLEAFHENFPATKKAILYPSLGLRPGDIEEAIASGLDGSTQAEKDNSFSLGLDWARQIDMTEQTSLSDEEIVPWCSWAEAPENWYPDYPSPITYLSELAAAKGYKVAGENANLDATDGEIQLMFSHVQTIPNLLGLFWLGESQLYSGNYDMDINKYWDMINWNKAGHTGTANLAMNKLATASSNEMSPDQIAGRPGNAVDGTDKFGKKWISEEGGPQWLQVDLGSETTIDRWVVLHAGMKDDASSNTKDFQLLVSSNGTNWTTVDTVTGNLDDRTDRMLSEPVQARYLKLEITKPTLEDDGSGKASIYEFEVYNTAMNPAPHEPIQLVTTPPIAVPDENGVLFSSGLETGDQQLSWLGEFMNQNNVSGLASVNDDPLLEASSQDAFTGEKAMKYSGNVTGAAGTTSFSYFNAFSVNIPVTADTKMSYWFKPSSDRGRFAVIDFITADNGSLRDSGAADSDGISMHPTNARGTKGQWSQVKVNIGEKLAGKTIKTIMIGFETNLGPGEFSGLMDDIVITNGEMPAPPLAEGVLFDNGFEDGELKPDGGLEAQRDIAGYHSGNPSVLVNRGLSHEGNKSLMFSGTDNSSGPSYVNYFLYKNVNLPVSETTKLSYWFYPENEPARHAVIDFIFTDGSVMRDADGAKDDGNVGMHASNARGQTGKWRQINVDVGSFAAGKTIASIMLDYEDDSGVGPFKGWVDELLISNNEPTSGVYFRNGGEPGDTAPTTYDYGVSNIDGANLEKSSAQKHTGESSIKYSGDDKANGNSYANLGAFDANVVITKDTKLSYWFYPVTDSARNAAVDMTFVGGGDLRGANKQDQNGITFHPAHKRGVVGQWNQVVVDIGSSASGTDLIGKTINKIVIDYGDDPYIGLYEGYIDDILLSDTVPIESMPSEEGVLFQTGLEQEAELPDLNGFENLKNVTGEEGTGQPVLEVSGERVHSGESALKYAGLDNSNEQSHSVFLAYDVNIPVSKDTKLSYWFYPETEMGRYASVDFVMTDGSNLRDSGAFDYASGNMHPAGGRGTVGAWNLVQADIGLWLNNKTIDKIIINYDRNEGTGVVKGYIDDLVIASGTLNPTLKQLSINAGAVSLDPSFSISTRTYTASVDHDVTSIELIAVAADSNDVVTINGSVHSGTEAAAIDLHEGDNEITIAVASDETPIGTYEYKLHIVRAEGEETENPSAPPPSSQPAADIPAPTAGQLAEALTELQSRLTGLSQPASGQEDQAFLRQATNLAEKAIEELSLLDVSGLVNTSGGKSKLDMDAAQLSDLFTVVKQNADKVNAELSKFNPAADKAGITVTLDLGSQSDTQAEIVIDAALIKKAKEAGINRLAVTVNGVFLSVHVSEFQGATSISIAKKPNTEVAGTSGVKAASEVYDIEFLDSNNNKVTFAKPVVIKIPLTNVDGLNTELLTLAKLVDGKLEYYGGSYNKDDKSFEAERKAFSSYVVVEHQIGFTDTANVSAWAGEEIAMVAAKGIIQGRGQEKFAPNEQVTRAEFAAMIIKAFHLEDASAEAAFTDVKSSDWFYPSIAAAVQAGIINGRTQDSFAPNEPISRAEMAAIAARALITVKHYKNVTDIEAELAAFQDRSSISASLSGGVALAASLGILEGYNNRFYPNEWSTRAQAAVVIGRLLTIS